MRPQRLMVSKPKLAAQPVQTDSEALEPEKPQARIAKAFRVMVKINSREAEGRLVWMRRSLDCSDKWISFLLRTVCAGQELEVQLLRMKREMDVTIKLLWRGPVDERTYLAQAVISLERVQPGLKLLLGELETAVECCQLPSVFCVVEVKRLAAEFAVSSDILRRMRCQLIADMYPELRLHLRPSPLEKRFSPARALARQWISSIRRYTKVVGGGSVDSKVVTTMSPKNQGRQTAPAKPKGSSQDIQKAPKAHGDPGQPWIIGLRWLH